MVTAIVVTYYLSALSLVGVVVWTFWPRDPAADERRAQFGEWRPWR